MIEGPIPELSVAEDRAILLIHMHESQNTPHIHSSGKVYSRQADVADPVPLTDRAELDELYSRR